MPRTKKKIPRRKRSVASRAQRDSVPNMSVAGVREFNYKVSSQAAPVAIASLPVRSVSISYTKEAGEDIAVLRGTAPIALVYKLNLNNGPFLSINNSGAVTTENCIYFNPFYGTNGEGLFATSSVENNVAQSYNRFKFTKVMVTYVSRTTTSNPGSLLFGYYPDGVIEDGDVSNGLLYASPCSTSVPVWMTSTVDISRFLPKDWFYSDYDTGGGDAGVRQSFQGAIIGSWDTTPSAGVYYGYIWISYELRLKDPSGIGNFASPAPPRRPLRPKRLMRRAKDSVESKDCSQIPELKVEPSLPQDVKLEGATVESRSDSDYLAVEPGDERPSRPPPPPQPVARSQPSGLRFFRNVI